MLSQIHLPHVAFQIRFIAFLLLNSVQPKQLDPYNLVNKSSEHHKNFFKQHAYTSLHLFRIKLRKTYVDPHQSPKQN